MDKFNQSTILIVGYGSIGKKHFELLRKELQLENIHIVTAQNVANVQTFKRLEDLGIKQLEQYSIFLICSETCKHAAQLKYIDQRVNNKLIVVEKPIFATAEIYKPKNKVVVAYNLRFHPIIQKLKEYLEHDSILTFSARVGQYLPTWRPNQDYRTSYSADINRGGGVLRDLSHELDYTSMFCGKLEIIGAISGKYSDLDINADDICLLLCKNKNNVAISIHLDYLAFNPTRIIEIQTKSKTVIADFIKNNMTIFAQEQKTFHDFNEYDKNHSYIQMHFNILEKAGSEMCSYDEANQVTELIDNITAKYMDIT